MENTLLQDLIKHAYNTVPYYKNTFDEYGIDVSNIKTVDDLEKIPLLTKEAIQNSPNSFISSEYNYYPKRKDIHIKRTSGSTGRYLKIHWDKNDDTRSLFYMWMIRKKLYGVDPSSRFCSFYTTLYNGNKLVEDKEKKFFYQGSNLVLSKIGFSEANIKDYYMEILKFDPVWIFAQPSIAYLMAEYISRNNLEIPASLKYIELTGEYLFDNYREKIEDTFGVRVANQYGCNEVNGIAMDCCNKNMHCLSNNVIVEILKDGKKVRDGEEGDIYITSLSNTATPFIRYAIGDRGRLASGSECSCGNKSAIVKLSSSRISQYVSLADGQKINCYVFLYTIEKINENMGTPIKQFKIVQTGIDQFTVYFVIKESLKGWKDSICKCFTDNIREAALKKAKWNFQFTDSIYPDLKTGKLHFFVNNTNNINTEER